MTLTRFLSFLWFRGWKPGSVSVFRSQKSDKDSGFRVLDRQHTTLQTDITPAFLPSIFIWRRNQTKSLKYPQTTKMNKQLIEPEALALQRCHAAYVGRWLQTFWDSLWVRSWGDNQSKKNNWLKGIERLFRNVDNHHLRRVTCQKIGGLSYTVAQAWNPALVKFIVA